ncbi:MAG: corrinoid protein [Candidatus Latescibacteria bacterium]|jgi:5-methyltetrahydrofolate--homocysteine methyltransferase|nr:corrinoid protein [Candidatus Latescibacterota bacterium]
MTDLNAFAENVISGQASAVDELVRQALDEGSPESRILDEGLIAGMDVVGGKFKDGPFYIPEVLIAARAMKAGMDLIQPGHTAEGVKPLGTACVGTVKGYLHDIGKNLVIMMLQGAGFEVVDLGIDVPPEDFVTAAQDGAQLVCMSALQTTTMGSMEETIQALHDAGYWDYIRALVDGAPITQAFAERIGADGFGPDAASAADLAKEFIVELRETAS